MCMRASNRPLCCLSSLASASISSSRLAGLKAASSSSWLGVGLRPPPCRLWSSCRRSYSACRCLFSSSSSSIMSSSSSLWSASMVAIT
uniref:Uncharacterized protein n=1 Tax=Ixodes ricinus TaxID=34613 RepID=A0A6B0U9V4_IXORI